MSRALPCGSPSTMSTSTTSAYPRSASRCASDPPTMPAPTTVILYRDIFLFTPWTCGTGRQYSAIHGRGEACLALASPGASRSAEAFPLVLDDLVARDPPADGPQPGV